MRVVAKNQILRRAMRLAVGSGLRFGGAAMVGLLLGSTVSAQLRTGRETDRDFYQPEPFATAPKEQEREKTNARKGAVKKSDGRDTAVGQTSSITQRNVPSPKSSRVEQAGCKNCQAGVSHSHESVPVAEIDESNLVYESSEDVGEFDMDFAEPQPMRRRHRAVASSSSPCDNPCDSHGMAHPLGFLGQLLRRSEFKIEAATFWPEGQNLPELVASGVGPLFGGQDVLQEAVQGIRGEFGTFFGPNERDGVLLRFFDVGNNALSFNSMQDPAQVVQRPFLAVPGLTDETIAINSPGLTTGALNANISSEVYGGDILFRHLISRNHSSRAEFLAGYQTARLADDLSIVSRTELLPTPNVVSELEDRFETTNRFNGLALGLSGALQDRSWSLSGMVKLGLGNMERSVGIDGSSIVTVPNPGGSVSSTNNGLLARASNNGSYTSSTFVVSPELNLSLGYRITRGLDATLGYTYLGLPKVARVADQLDPALQSNLSNPLVGPVRPSFELLESNFSLHSLSYGLQFKF